MTSETVRAAVEILMALFLVAGTAVLLRYYALRLDKDGKPMGIGLRAVQTVVSVMLVPTVLILSMERIIDSSVVGTLLGGLLGYVLSPKEKD